MRIKETLIKEFVNIGTALMILIFILHIKYCDRPCPPPSIASSTTLTYVPKTDTTTVPTISSTVVPSPGPIIKKDSVTGLISSVLVPRQPQQVQTKKGRSSSFNGIKFPRELYDTVWVDSIVYEYYLARMYSDIYTDSLIMLQITDSVSQNRIHKRNIHYQLLRPLVSTNTTISHGEPSVGDKKFKTSFYLGFGLTSALPEDGTATQYMDLLPKATLLIKQQQMYIGAGYSPFSNRGILEVGMKIGKNKTK